MPGPQVEQDVATHVVACSGGLNTQASSLMLGRPDNNGFAQTLINFEPWKGYRRISGTTAWDNTGVTTYASAIVRGVCVWGNGGVVLQCRDTSSTVYSIYSRGPADSTWTAIATAQAYTGSNASGRVRFAKIGFSSGSKVVFVDGVNYARTWDGTSFTTLNGTSAPTNPSLVATIAGKLVLAGFSSAPNTIAISNDNDETTWNSGNAAQINVGDVVTAIREWRDQLIVFCADSIYKLQGTSVNNFALSAVTKKMGCTAPDSIFELGGDLYWWGGDGVRTIRGTNRIDDFEMGTVTIPIRPTVLYDTQQFDFRKLVSVVVQSKTQFRLFFSQASLTGSSENYARGILGGLNLRGNLAWGSSAYNFEFAELLGLNPTSADSDYINGVEYVMHGGYDGIVYQQESGNDFAGRPIAAVYITPDMDINDPFVRKTYKRLLLYVTTEGAGTFYMRPIFDWDDSTKMVRAPNQTVPYTYQQSIYGNPTTVYGTAVYGAHTMPALILPMQGSSHTLGFQFVSNTSQPSFSIQGFAIEHILEGRA